jgi:hypothetical protein
MQATGKLFDGPLPTSAEVNSLMEYFQDVAEGVVVSHQDLAALIGIDYGKSRYRTVIQAFARRLLRERNLQLGVVVGQGYKILTPSERVSVATTVTTYAFKKMHGAYERFAAVPRDRLATEAERKILDNRQILIAKLIEESDQVKNAMALQKSEVLPRLAIIPK